MSTANSQCLSVLQKEGHNEHPIALGRANWIHIGSEQAGPRIAAILSVVESCRRLKIPIRNYLADILPGLANASFSTPQKSLLWLGLQNIRSYHHAFSLTHTPLRRLPTSFRSRVSMSRTAARWTESPCLIFCRIIPSPTHSKRIGAKYDLAVTDNTD